MRSVPGSKRPFEMLRLVRSNQLPAHERPPLEGSGSAVQKAQAQICPLKKQRAGLKGENVFLLSETIVLTQ